MNRRAFLQSALGGLSAPSLLLSRKTAAERPNILFIASDDMNNNLGCYGHAVVKTPNLDRLASSGLRFDRAYCQFPLCGPSRCSLMTGLRPDTTRILENNIAPRDTMPDVLTLPQLFRNNQWRSIRAGKMYHMDVPGSVGTNKWDDPPSWDVAISPPGAEQHTKGVGRNINEGRQAAWHYVAFQGEGKDQADERATEIALETIGKTGGQPWFLGLGYLRPHLPHVAPERFFDLYPLSRIQPVHNPPGDRDDIPKASELAINTRANDMGMNEADKKEAIRAYYASISYMDWQVGKVLDALDKQSLARSTVVVFWGDHGWHLGEHHRWHKRSLFEESARAPLIVRAPGRKGNGQACRSLVEFVDIYPTVAELGGLRGPDTVEGQSLVPLLDNPARAWKSAAFTQMYGPKDVVGRSVVNHRYRYMRWTGPYPDEELYDHQTDAREFTNLARNPSHAQTLNRMRALLDAGWKAARAKEA
jgi:uncharacterized sulfatase